MSLAVLGAPVDCVKMEPRSECSPQNKLDHAKQIPSYQFSLNSHSDSKPKLVPGTSVPYLRSRSYIFVWNQL